jgi:hypothetical protein
VEEPFLPWYLHLFVVMLVVVVSATPTLLVVVGGITMSSRLNDVTRRGRTELISNDKRRARERQVIMDVWINGR